MRRKAVKGPDSESPQSTTLPALRLLETDIAPGEIVNERYEVQRVLAEGGMGIVVAARHLELEETVAIKFLKPEFAKQPDIIGRFAREAKAVAKIRSDRTAMVLDVGVSIERGPYIVMEYLEGKDLDEILEERGRLPIARGVEIVMQAGEALAAAHAHGIVHRDVKPENLFISHIDDTIPTVKVLDFGVSKTALTGNVFGGAISLVKTQNLLGSPLYMSPEQLRAKGEITPATDIWSLGVVLYQLLTGEVPFHGTTVTEVCAAVLETTAPPMKTFTDEIPSELETVVRRCLERDPERRFKTIAELMLALAPFGPRRVRLSLERAVSISMSAGMLPSTFSIPNSIPPPGSTSMGPAANSTPISLPAIVSTPPSQGEERAARGGSLKWVAIGGAFLLVAVGIGVIATLTKSPSDRSPAEGSAETATSKKETPPSAESTPLPTINPPAETTTAPPPSAHAPKSARPPWLTVPSRGAALPLRPTATATQASATPSAPTPTPRATPTLNATQSAIDDRK